MFQQRLEQHGKATGLTLATKCKRAARRSSAAIRAAWYSELSDQSGSNDKPEDEFEDETDEEVVVEEDNEEDREEEEDQSHEPEEDDEVVYDYDLETDNQAVAEPDIIPPMRVKMSRYAFMNAFIF